MAKNSVAFIRKQVFARANGLCEYCFLPEEYSASAFELEHIYPVSKGGETTLENLALSCPGCNKYKSHRISAVDSETKETISFFDPRKDVWEENFSWSEDFTEIIALTAKGRVTIKPLKLNHGGLKNLRKFCILSASIRRSKIDFQ